MREVVIKDGCLTFLVDKALYSSEVLSKCFYWYSRSFDVNVLEVGAGNLRVDLKSKDGILPGEDIVSKIKQDLIDFRLRDILTKETATIRELLIAKAFSNYDASAPETEVSDPVGFNPELIP